MRISPVPQTHKPCFVYLISGFGSSLVKVGLTNDPRHRLCGLQIGCNEPLTTRLVMEFPDRETAKIVERDLHIKLKKAGRHERGEWFRVRDWEVDLMVETFRDCGVARVLSMTLMDISEPV